jgi:single-strand DNA-binding protein
MASLNKVFLIGNLTRAPELRYTPSGTAVADLRLAVNRNYTTQGGEKRDETCFLTVVVWGKQAESSTEYLDKGSPVMVEGRLQTRDWETKDGQKRNVVEVVAERVQFMGRGRRREGHRRCPRPWRRMAKGTTRCPSRRGPTAPPPISIRGRREPFHLQASPRSGADSVAARSASSASTS